MAEDMAARAKRRAKKISETSILDWTTACMSGMLRYIEQYQRTGDEAALAEVSMNLGTLNIMVDELVTRREARNEEQA